MSAYFLTISNPIAERPVSRAASSVLPVPTNGSTTNSPFLVKKETKSLTSDSGNEAGCRIFRSPRGSGRWTNHDFVNLIQSLPESSFSLFLRVAGVDASRRTVSVSTMPVFLIKRDQSKANRTYERHPQAESSGKED